MPLYKKKWWKKLFSKKRGRKIVDCLRDLAVINEFLQEAHNDEKFLRQQLKELEELEKEFHVAKSGVIQVNIDTQVKVLDKILQRYEFFQNDVDINGLRLKRITKEVINRAKKAGMNDLVAEKQKDRRWSLRW